MPKKKAKAVKLVAPEPDGDEWDTNINWDKISALDNPPKFFNGAHTFASENPFKIPVYDVVESSPKKVNSHRPGFALERAADVYVRAEKKFMDAKERLREGDSAISDFTFLHKWEDESAAEIRGRIQNEYTAVVDALSKSENDFENIINRTVAAFFFEQRNLLNRIFNLLLHDHEIEEAFNEKVARTAECERIVDEYYYTHGKHVMNMEHLQNEAAEERQTALLRMKDTLHKTAHDLMQAVIPHGPDPSAELRRAELIRELLRLHNHSRDLLERREEVINGTDQLKRLVSLESQKLQMTKARNALLHTQLEKLKETSRQQESLEASPSESYMVGVEVHYDESATPHGVCTEQEDLMNVLTRMRTEIDQTTAELEEKNEKLQHLRQYHLLQLSGRYKPVCFAADAIKTTRSFLDPETNAAVRSAIIESMLEIDRALHYVLPLKFSRQDGVLAGHPTKEENEWESTLHCLDIIESMKDRKAVQNFVASRINRLFTDLHVTAPALTLLQHGVQ